MKPHPKPSLQERYRQALRVKLGACKECGHPTGGLRELSEAIGLPGGPSTLWRFLQGKDARGSTLDKIDAFLSGASN